MRSDGRLTSRLKPGSRQTKPGPTTYWQIPDNQKIFFVKNNPTGTPPFMPSSPALSGKSKNPLPLQPSLHLPATQWVLLLSLVLCGGLAGCGPASDNTQNLGPRANVAGTPMAQKSPPPRNDQAAPAASPVPFTSDSGNGSGSGRRTAPEADNSSAAPIPSAKPTDPIDSLVVPAWMAKELKSPDVGTRLRALETWVKSAPPGAIDPLILAYEDKDERVRARAMELIEQDWARAAEAVN